MVSEKFERDEVEEIKNLLLDQISISDEIFILPQAADFLHISAYTVYSMVRRQAIPHSKRGKRLYFSKSELIKWVKNGNTKKEVTNG